MYPEDWAGLSFDALAAIKEAVGDLPLVLHGGTGIPVDQIQKAISLGVSKINVNTDLQLVFAAATREYIEAGKDLEGKGFGVYPEDWAGLSFDALAAIKEAVGDLPLVLHGGTGIPVDQIQKAISLGVSKINVNTDLQLVFAAATREYIEAGKDLEGKGFDPRKVLKPGREAIVARTKELMEEFGSVNKA